METQTKKQSQNFNVANTELLYMSINSLDTEDILCTFGSS